MRLGYDKTELTVHELRSTASVLLNESSRWQADTIERQLAHRPCERRRPLAQAQSSLNRTQLVWNRAFGARVLAYGQP